MALKIALDPARPSLDVLVVAEVIKSENKKDITISWDKTWDKDSNVCLYDKDEEVLGERNNEVSRYLARTINPALYDDTCPHKRTEIDHWISCAMVLQNKEKNELLNYLNNVLLVRTWLVGNRLTLADIHVFSVLHNKEYMKLHESDYCNVTRWYKHMRSLPVVSNAISMIAKNCLPPSKPKEKSAAKQTKTRKQEGKFSDLPGAEMGKVVVRIPQYYIEAFQGQLIIRFDDTNPAKETVEFEDAILEDLRLLQHKPDRFTHTSDYFEMKKQCDKIRNLKSVIDQEVKVLLNLKRDYKNGTDQDYKSADTEVASIKSKTKPENKEISKAKKISEEIEKQGDKVRNLKSSKVDRSVIDQEVNVLLSLKSDYKNTTGQDWKPANSEAASKKEKQNSSKPGRTSEKEVAKNADSQDVVTSKTGTRLGLEAKKEENFSDWYSQVITKSEMIEYCDVSGCHVFRPWSFSIWKMIRKYIDKEITELGVKQCLFSMFGTRDALEKEKAHITDFAPEVAWVTKWNEEDLEEPLAIRPTSETIMYPDFAKWLKSDDDLPLKLNQWCNVVRWEFKDPKPFLRTREFLWQEGHTAFATQTEAEEEVLTILDIYARVYEELLAVPVIKGRKTEKEKFAGGDYTTTVEAFISTNGRAIQGATSHHLGQNFSKIFNIQIEADGEKTFVYQNSWGLTTRTIGVMIMAHGDDRGLVLPPNVASIQVVVIPCGIVASMSESKKEELQNECTCLVRQLKINKFRVREDFRPNRTPGWKFNYWELKGVPIRIEFGPRDMERNEVTLVRRDNLEREVVKRDELILAVTCMLKKIQDSLLQRARRKLDERIKQVENWNEFKLEHDNKNLLLSPFCGKPECEDKIKEQSARLNMMDGTVTMGAKSLCIPFKQPELTKPINELKCIHQDCENKAKFYTLFGRSY
ncbi:uncharacterized protein LOC143901394 isoform X1 [Temnothorax americanus]|uniref:uncharacterized protein LOC143901394 isoform X1 n=1 Tax=Temnothorax americanus TaxID=1964332 RepID=UPI00406765D4